MAKKSRSKIGFDPLAWMKQESETEAEPKQELAAASTVCDPEHDGQVVNENSAAQDTDTTKASGNNVAQIKVNTEADTTDVPDESIANETIILCGVSIGFADIDALYQELHQALVHKLSVKIDAGQVKSIHAAAIQLLAVFMSEADRSGVDVEWQSLSESMRHAVSIIGLSDMLPAPGVV